MTLELGVYENVSIKSLYQLYRGVGSNIKKNETRWFAGIDPELKRQLSIAAIELDMTLKEVNSEALVDWLRKHGREVPADGAGAELEAIA
ncbi:hypothetical protein [Coleofasciculus sp. FACHB-T130]|uniref:hypothetical protein n=1 Tax=Cyanophyceae TaxID=3028117 RepID=UPI0016876D86|nr:hypothetical protein [Coleofasciculus sp. FACHB-T130]MBD1878363.1 hypothetical protein [Coleofasciculus sp. FACHB-T130]